MGIKGIGDIFGKGKLNFRGGIGITFIKADHRSHNMIVRVGTQRASPRIRGGSVDLVAASIPDRR